MPRFAGRPETNSHAPHRIALIGFMGSGKTTVGRLVAARLGYRFLDLDVLITENAGKASERSSLRMERKPSAGSNPTRCTACGR